MFPCLVKHGKNERKTERKEESKNQKRKQKNWAKSLIYKERQLGTGVRRLNGEWRPAVCRRNCRREEEGVVAVEEVVIVIAGGGGGGGGGGRGGGGGDSLILGMVARDLPSRTNQRALRWQRGSEMVG